jgi:pimeloyl-ACP methyl ester carboxylesterase
MNDEREHWQEFDVEGVGIEFIEHGRGAPVFLVHAGVFGDWFRFVCESDALRDFRVVRLRRAGYGQSQPARPLTLTDHARHAAALAALPERADSLGGALIQLSDRACASYRRADSGE